MKSWTDRDWFFTCLVFALTFSLSPISANAQTKYNTVQEALNAANSFLRARNYEGSREPLEAALELTDDTRMKIRIYDSLLPAYRQISEHEPYFEACEYILIHSDSEAKASITTRSLLNFAQQRGKLEALAERYEAKVKQDEESKLSLMLLATLYSGPHSKPDKAFEYGQKYVEYCQAHAFEPSTMTLNSLATSYLRSQKYIEVVALYKMIQEQKPEEAGHCQKGIVDAWHRSGDQAKTEAALIEAEKIGPDTRSEQLTHYWHRRMGEVYLDLGNSEAAIPHLEKAISTTSIDGYKQDCQELLTKALRSSN